mgnify:CR=1 FL=1
MKQSTNLINYDMLNEGPAPEGSCGAKKANIKLGNLITYDDTVGYDHQGWPLHWLRVLSLLRAIGMSEDIITQIPKNILTSKITTLEDDSMGYGINEECIVDCAIDKDKNTVYLWRIPNVRVVNSRKAPKEDEHD